MSRECERITRKLEKNPVKECNQIQKKFYPELFSKFAHVKDLRHSSYIEYSIKEMLGTVYYKGIAGISSMQGITLECSVKKIRIHLRKNANANIIVTRKG